MTAHCCYWTNQWSKYKIGIFCSNEGWCRDWCNPSVSVWSAVFYFLSCGQCYVPWVTFPYVRQFWWPGGSTCFTVPSFVQHQCFSSAQWVWFVSFFGIFVPLKSFSFIWSTIVTGEGLQILTYGYLSWPLSSEGTLTYHTNCDGEYFIMVLF